MATRLIASFSVMAVCVCIHAFGLAWPLRWLRRGSPRYSQNLLSSLRLFIAIAVWIALLHIIEISVWAGVYAWNDALPDIATALYFSAVTYTTTGYGDVLLPKGWRLDGGVEALTGILMCGWSTGFFFAIVNRLYDPAAGATPIDVDNHMS